LSLLSQETRWKAICFLCLKRSCWKELHLGTVTMQQC
jgi:hypothetical protein